MFREWLVIVVRLRDKSSRLSPYCYNVCPFSVMIVVNDEDNNKKGKAIHVTGRGGP
jgi:hypothetical protein